MVVQKWEASARFGLVGGGVGAGGDVTAGNILIVCILPCGTASSAADANLLPRLSCPFCACICAQLGTSAGIFYGYVFILSILLWLWIKYMRGDIKLVNVFCMYGQCRASRRSLSEEQAGRLEGKVGRRVQVCEGRYQAVQRHLRVTQGLHLGKGGGRGMYAGEEEREGRTRECSSSKMAGCKVAIGSTWLACCACETINSSIVPASTTAPCSSLSLFPRRLCHDHLHPHRCAVHHPQRHRAVGAHHDRHSGQRRLPGAQPALSNGVYCAYQVSAGCWVFRQRRSSCV